LFSLSHIDATLRDLERKWRNMSRIDFLDEIYQHNVIEFDNNKNNIINLLAQWNTITVGLLRFSVEMKRGKNLKNENFIRC